LSTPLRTIVRFCGVEKSFGETHVLRELDLEVFAGETLALIGPSGSGKSTLLRVLMGLEPIDAGCVEIDGEILWDGPHAARSRRERAQRRELLRRVGMVFQHFHLFPHRTALANLSLAPRKVLDLDAASAETRALELLRRVGLEDKASCYPQELSGGQKQRVAIARALALDPEILLFDEVTSALDPELVGEVLDVLRELAEDGGRTRIVVTHQMDFAYEVADRVVFMDQGRVVEQGLPEEIFRAPRQERTRVFLRSVLQSRSLRGPSAFGATSSVGSAAEFAGSSAGIRIGPVSK